MGRLAKLRLGAKAVCLSLPAPGGYLSLGKNRAGGIGMSSESSACTTSRHRGLCAPMQAW